MRELKKITVNLKAENALKSGHPWVYAEEVVSREDGIENGDIVDVYSHKNRYLGSGFYNDNSKILVRVFSKNPNDKFDYDFFKRRISYAVNYRRSVMGEDFSACRLVFGDSDGLPGFIADRFENVIVTQIMCLGIEKRKEDLFRALVEVMSEAGEKISAVYERNDVAVREKEGLTQGKGLAYGELFGDGHVKITENGVIYDVDYVNGQKTGFFLDQKYNRLTAAKVAKGKNVLDCFTHTGSFALNCAKAGAKSVTAVDISADAVNESRLNASLNGIDNIDFICMDVFDYLERLYENGRCPFDFIILDPPAFTKSRETVKNAYRGYKEINLKAMRLLKRGSFLATASCSHFMTDELFRKMLFDAANDAGVSVKIAQSRAAAPDHPEMLGIPETKYLKFYLVQIV